MTRTVEPFPGTPGPLADAPIPPSAAEVAAAGWITKAEAAALAKVTTKTIERWAKSKWIRQGSRPSPKNGPDMAVYWGPSVARQAIKTAQRGPAGLRVPALDPTLPDAPGVALSPAPGGLLAPVFDPVTFGMALLTAFRQVSPTSQTAETLPPAFVDVATFARLAGLPAADITRAVEAGELPIRRTARGGVRLWAADVARLRPKGRR